jgi:hypothetical protein
MNATYTKPEVGEVYSFLRQRDALIEHFSGIPKGSGSNFDYVYPDDLKNVIALQAPGGLSCSVVIPSDEFADLSGANATGCIGIVLGFQNRNSLVAANPHDCGSYMENGVRLVPNERDLTIPDLLDTILKRPSGNYNEWVVRDYTVLGVFAARPYFVSVREIPAYPPEMLALIETPEPEIGFRPTTIGALRETFPLLPILTFEDGKLMRLSEGRFEPVDHGAIYKNNQL